MKTRLSMPSTISSTESVASANQAFGSNSSATIGFQPVSEADRDHLDCQHDQAAGHPWARVEIAENGNRRKTRPGQHCRDVEAAQPDDAERMHARERDDRPARERSRCVAGK